MKKILFIFTLILPSAALFSQLWVGGSMGFRSTTTKESSGSTSIDGPSSATFQLIPMVGYRLDDKIDVGGELTFALISNNNHDTPTATKTFGTAWGISPFLRYRLIEHNALSIFGQGSIGVGFSKSKSKTGNITTDGPKIMLFNIGIKPGIAYKFSDKISIQAYLGGLYYNFTSTEFANNTKDKSNTFGMELSTSLNLGFTYEF